MGVDGEKTVEKVMSDVDASIGEPPCEGRIGCLKDGLGEGEPL